MPDLSPQGLRRRLKRHLLKADAAYFANTAPGFEAELAAEVAALPGVTTASRTLGGVAFRGPLDLTYHANLRLRSAHRILLRVDDFLAQSHPMLFDHARKVPWERYLGFHDDFAVTVSTKSSRLNHRAQIAQTFVKAVQRAMADLGLEPRHDDSSPRRIVLRLFRDRCTVSIDTSGEHLHRRHYRGYLGRGPIRETLAAATLLRLGSAQYACLVDPFCGSGTLLIEAAALDAGLPPGLGRPFAFEQLAFFDRARWQRIVAAATPEPPRFRQRFLGTDIDPRAVEGARQNAAAAGVDAACSFEAAAAQALTLPDIAGRGLVIANLPYGARVPLHRAQLRQFLERLRAQGRGWDYAFVTPNLDDLEAAGLTISDTVAFRNGGIRVLLAAGSVGDHPQG